MPMSMEIHFCIIDSYGLFGMADMPSLPQGLVDFSAGFGDTLSFGATNWVREQMGVNGEVNKCSGYYRRRGSRDCG